MVLPTRPRPLSRPAKFALRCFFRRLHRDERFGALDPRLLLGRPRFGAAHEPRVLAPEEVWPVRLDPLSVREQLGFLLEVVGVAAFEFGSRPRFELDHARGDRVEHVAIVRTPSAPPR